MGLPDIAMETGNSTGGKPLISETNLSSNLPHTLL